MATALLLWPALAAAQQRGGLAVQVYSDDDDVDVVTTSVSASGEQGPVRVSAGWMLDVVSAASVDLVSAASPRGFSESRNAVNVGADLKAGSDAWLGLTAAGSLERDYLSRAAGLRGSLELDERNTTLELRAVHAEDEVGRAGDGSVHRRRAGDRVELTLTRILDPLTAVDVGGTALFQRGYLASPYRFVHVGGEGGGTAVEEAAPDGRSRAGLLLRMRRRLLDRTFAAVDLQGAADDWGVVDGAGQVRISHGLGEEVTVTGRVRGYAQTAASFWQASYDTFPSAPRFRTIGRDLARMWSLLGGARLELDLAPRPFDAVSLDVGVELMGLHYPDDPRQRRRTAVVGSLGAEVSF